MADKIASAPNTADAAHENVTSLLDALSLSDLDSDLLSLVFVSLELRFLARAAACCR